MDFQNQTLEGWAWGKGPRIMIVPGWGGSGERMKAFIQPLVNAGFEVVTFDGPAHGRSPTKRTNVLEFSHFLLKVIETAGPFYGVIGHSFGAASTVYGMHLGLQVERAILIAPFTDSNHNLARFAEQLKLTPRIHHKTLQRLLDFFGEHKIGWDLCNVAEELDTKILVLHDHGDTEVPYSDSVKLVARLKNAELIQTAGLGHRKIIQSPETVARCLAFLSREKMAL